MKYLLLTLIVPGLTVVPTAVADDAKSLDTRIYQVADLVVEPPVTSIHEYLMMVADVNPHAADAADRVDRNSLMRPEARIKDNLNELVEVIRTTTMHAHWTTDGGFGTIIPHVKTRSLVVRQYPPVHDRISNLLRHLRDLHDTRVDITVEMVMGVSEETFSQRIQQVSGTSETTEDGKTPVNPDALTAEYGESMDATELADLKSRFPELSGSAAVFTKSVRNGVSEITATGLLVTPTISEDRRTITLNLAQVADPGLLISSVATVSDGHTVLFRPHTWAPDGTIFLITPRIRITEEEEEVVPR